KILEVAPVERKLTFNVLTDRDRPLLAVHDLVLALISLLNHRGVTDRPVHHVEWVALHDCVDNRVALPILVDELTLVRRPTVKAAPVADNARLVIVLIAVDEISNGDFSRFDLQSRLFLITMRSYMR